MGSDSEEAAEPTATQVIVSFATLGAVFYVIVCKQYASNDTKWAYGIVGTVIAYWLKGKWCREEWVD